QAFRKFVALGEFEPTRFGGEQVVAGWCIVCCTSTPSCLGSLLVAMPRVWTGSFQHDPILPRARILSVLVMAGEANRYVPDAQLFASKCALSLCPVLVIAAFGRQRHWPPTAAKPDPEGARIEINTA